MFGVWSFKCFGGEAVDVLVLVYLYWCTYFGTVVALYCALFLLYFICTCRGTYLVFQQLNEPVSWSSSLLCQR